MSEQTPDTENGMADGQEPSMEDILASIRKIIAEDDVQAPSTSETAIAEVVPDVSNLAGDISEHGHVETLDLDILDDEVAPTANPDIESLIGDMDASASDDIASSASRADDSLEDILDLEIPMDEAENLVEIEAAVTTPEIDLAETETLTLDDELIDLVADVEPVVEDAPSSNLMGGAMAALGLGGAAAIAKGKEPETEVGDSKEEDLSLMLDNMLEDSASYQEDITDSAEERVIDPAADLLSDDTAGEELLAELDFIDEDPETTFESSEVISKADPDIDLVKSLMADLTETSLHDEDLLPENELESESEALMAESEEHADASAGDVMDEILSITLDDEAKLSEELSIPELTVTPDIGMPSVEEIGEDLAQSESLSLKEIAAAAEAEAEAHESGLSAKITAGLGAAAIGGAAAMAMGDDTSETQALETQVPEILTQDIPASEGDKDDVDEALSQLDTLLAVEETVEPDDAAPEAEEAEESELDDFTAEVVTLEPETPELQTPELEISELETPEPIIEETPDMARAKKTDAIIDEVTETATAGAFASLNQVVEEKATVAERGDRIGDLVMEALQPMLKEWLDANLKGIVERAVTKEVKRISSGK